MGDADALEAKWREIPRCARCDLVNRGAIFQVMLLELVRQQTESQAGAVDRYVEMFKDVGQRADMIFMGMGENDRL